MRNIEIVEYFTFVNNNDIKLERYRTLEELFESVPKFVSSADKQLGKASIYIGIGADFWIIKEDGSKEFASLDFVNRKVNEERFSFCKDIEKLEIRLPEEVKMKFSELIEIL